jgi:protein transport protein SEC13
MHDVVATCSEDGKLKIWKKDLQVADKWELKQPEIDLNVPAWKVSWSAVGNMLAVSGGDNVVQIFKENTNGVFEQVSKVNDDGVLEEN